jgi:RNA polymerase sigma factor (sigma-70 family)
MKSIRLELQRIYDECARQFFTCALAITRSRESAEDAIHDAFCRSFRLKEAPKNLKAYMFRSVRNAAIDLRRKQARIVSMSDEYIFNSSVTPQQLLEKKITKKEVAQALLELTDDERETIVQHIYADLTFREISELRDRPMGTITSWYHRGINKLRQRMEK